MFPLINSPPRNRSIDDLLEETAKQLTRFMKDQLHILLLHWRIPNVIVTGPRHQFTGEEVVFVCLSRIATGDPWTRLIDGFVEEICGDGHMHSDGSSTICLLCFTTGRSMEI